MPGFRSAFYFSALSSDWTTPQNDKLWQDDVKNLFDPCPTGWRVPCSGEGDLCPWAGLTYANGPWQNNGITAGRAWTAPLIFGGTAWYGASGDRKLNGEVECLGLYASYWSTSTIDQAVHSFVFNLSNDSFNVTRPRSYGFPVRCVRE